MRMESLSDSSSSLVSTYKGMYLSESGRCLDPANSFFRGPLTKGESMSGRSEKLLESLSVSSITSFSQAERESWSVFFPLHGDPNFL